MSDKIPAGTAAGGDSTTSRRGFLRLAGVFSAVIGFMLGVPILGYLLAPLSRAADKGNWVDLGAAEEVGEEFVDKTYQNLVQDGWHKAILQQRVYVRKEGEGQYVALSNVCTHTACSVQWDATNKKFLCPCHGGEFDQSGKVVKGPPEKPLERFQTRVEKGRLQVRS